MKFAHPFVSQSIFTEIMNGGDKRLFALAYNGHQSAGDEVKIGLARTWVEDVLSICATKLDIPFSAMVHSFQTGDSFAISGLYRRRITKLMGQLEELSRAHGMNQEQKAYEAEKLSKAIKDGETVIHMNIVDFNAWIRAAMVDSLNLSPPQFHKDSYKEHIGEKRHRDPNTPRQEKSKGKKATVEGGGKPKVEYKRPRATQGSLSA